MVANYEVVDSSFYCINKVEICVRRTTEPCLFNYRLFGNEQYSAMLRAFNDNHEDCEQFKFEAVQKTFCNLLSCLCFTKVLNPRHWANCDVNEILKIGYKFLCKIADKFDEMWDILKLVEVCSIQMNVGQIEDESGVFELAEQFFPPSDENEEIIEEHTMISDFERADNEEEVEEPQFEENVNEQRSSIFPPKIADKSLLEILTACDENEEFYAILTSSLFNIAIFKINKFYYIFDPKASNGGGMLVKKRLENFIKRNLVKERDSLLEKLRKIDEAKRLSKEEEFQELLFGRPVVFGVPSIKPSLLIISNDDHDEIDDASPIQITDKGSAYVAWFTQLDLLHRHIINKIPERFRNEPFTITHVEITTESPTNSMKLSPWHNFDAITFNHWILRGTFSQNDAQFLQVHRDNQDAANCVIALTFANLCKRGEWNSTVVDVILTLGDRLFKNSLKDNGSNLKVSLSQLNLPVFIHPFIVNAEFEVIKKDYMVKGDDQKPLEIMKKNFNDFMGANSAGILISKDYYVAVWKDETDNALMMFDSHDIGPDGCKKSTGTACIQRFTDGDDLIDTFCNNVKDISGINEYQLIKLTINMDKFDDKSEEIPTFHHHQSAKTIRAKSIQAKSSESVDMSICYAVATLCVSRSLHPEFYTPDIIDRIIMFGNELAYECSSNDDVCFKDFDVGKKSSCPDNICWNFQLNDTFMSIQMDIFQRGLISKNVCPLPSLIFALEEFFSFHDVGVLVTREFIVSLWKENHQYFIFYSCEIDKDGKVVDKNGQPGLVILDSVHELYTNIIWNITKQDQSFELRICDIKTTENVEKDDELTARCSQKTTKKIPKEETIMPAVELRELKQTEETVKKSKCMVDELQSMVEKLMKKNIKSIGFIKFSRGGFLCGKLSKKSKSFNQFSRKYHVSLIKLLLIYFLIKN